MSWFVLNLILGIIGIVIAIPCLIEGGVGGIFWGAVFGIAGIGCLVNVKNSGKTISYMNDIDDELTRKKQRYEEAMRIINMYIDSGINCVEDIKDLNEQKNLQNIVNYIKDYQKKSDILNDFNNASNMSTFAAIVGGVAVGMAASQFGKDKDKKA